MRKWLRRLGLVFAIPALVLVGGLLWVAFQYLTYDQQDDEQRLASKADYLEQVAQSAPARPRDGRPNVLIIYYDDLGLGDLGFSGSSAIKTPQIDALAKEGLILSNFRSASAICSPARAALLTGRMPPRAGVPTVVFQTSEWQGLLNILPGYNMRIPAEEITIAEVLKADGYRTGMVGKWHIGDVAPSLPNLMGFDSFYGSLYSNDMQPFAIYRNEGIELEAPADQTQIDRLYTQEAVSFIREAEGGDAPFFLHFAHNFPHEPLFIDPAVAGRSDAGLYGDVVESLDRGVGEIVAVLRETGQFESTVIMLTSDNGPIYEGSPGGLRGRKGQTFDGGMRVPFLMHWPARIAPGQQSNAVAMVTDIFPTLLDWLAIPLPQDRLIDGVSLDPVITGQQDEVHDYIYFYAAEQLMAVSDSRFKYHIRQRVPYVVTGVTFPSGATRGPWLFDLPNDADESYDVSSKYTADTERLKRVLDARVALDLENPRGWRDN